MASYQFLQSSFAYGEISPRLIGRSDTDRYRQSLRICENAFTYSHGNCVKRPGTQFITQSETEGSVRLIDLQAEINEPYVLELGTREAGGYVRVLDHDGYVRAGEQYVKNQSFNDQLDFWTDASQGEQSRVEWASSTFARFLPDHNIAGVAVLHQQVTVPDATATYVLELEAIFETPEEVPRALVQVGLSPTADELLDDTFEQGVFNQPFAAQGNSTFYITITYDSALATNPISMLLNYVTLTQIGAGSQPFEASTPYTDQDLPELAYSSATHITSVYIVHPEHPPYRLVIAANGTLTWEPVPFVNQPSQWIAGNYPSAVTFHQQRLWLAATPNQPDTLWASRTALFNDFALGSGQPTDAIEFEMADRGVIKWISGARDLLIGGDVAEYIIASEGAAIAPGDISSRQQSSYGSAQHNPPGLGNGVLYLGNDRRRIRFQNYQFLEDGWVSVDITWPSEHVTRPLVKEIHFRYAPDPIIFLVMDDGTLVTAIYEREQNDLVGWHRHQLPEGNLLSAAVTKLEADNELWCAVERNIGPPGDEDRVVYIERLQSSQPSSTPILINNFQVTEWFMDSGVYRQVQEDNTQVPPEYFLQSLEHLEGKTVDIMIDTSVHIQRTVTNGRVDLQRGFQGAGDGLARVGLGYTGRMRLLPLEGGHRGGSAQATAKRRNRIFVRVLESALPIVNGTETGARFPITPMGEGEPSFTGDLQVANLGWDRFAEVEIEMPKPVRYNILSIFGDAETNTF